MFAIPRTLRLDFYVSSPKSPNPENPLVLPTPFRPVSDRNIINKGDENVRYAES